MEPSNNKTLILEKFSVLLSIGLSFLLPLFFLPTTTEFFEFNKMTLLVVGTILLVLMWAMRILLGQKIEFIKSSVDTGLLVFTAVFVLSTLFSLNKNISIFGSQGRWFPSLFGFLCIV